MAGNLTAMIASIFSGGVTPDPYYPYTTLLLPGNGTNGAQNNTFLDGSTNNFTITFNGNTTQGTFSPFSQTGWGNYFSGGANYLSVAASTSIDLASSDFTIECWAYPGTQTNAVDSVFGYGGFTTMLYRNGTTWSWEVGNGSSANYFTITATVTPNAWQHIALTRSGNTFTFWINGSSAGTNSTANAVGTASKSLTIGYNNTSPSAQYFTGYISNFRITKGRAVYTGAFTPPTVPLTRTTGGTNPPQGTECSLLTCQSNRFLDSNGVNTPASSPLTITPNGSPTVVAFSPFNPTASWSAATYGGSGYFDGNLDYLSLSNNVAFQFGTGDFTIEFWHYSNSSGTQVLLYDSRPATTNGLYPTIYKSSGNVLVFYTNSADRITGTTSLLASTWYHVALSRSGTATKLFLNGIQEGSTYTDSNNYTNGTSRPLIGGDGYNASSVLNGYLSDVRIVKGTAVYTGNFTPPSLFPLTNAGSTSAASYPSTTNVNTSFASSATSLLLNFTNAGIYDATSKNDLETVGNAQISTAISAKWGSGSIKFNGTTDYLQQPLTNLFSFAENTYTIEAWIYPTTSSGYRRIFSTSTSAAASVGYLALVVNGTSLVGETRPTNGGSVTSISGGTVNPNTWYHAALSVNNGSARLFLDGVQVGSTTSFPALATMNYVTVGAILYNSGASTGDFFTGYIQDLRITKGYARYTANFTAPTAAFPTL